LLKEIPMTEQIDTENPAAEKEPEPVDAREEPEPEPEEPKPVNGMPTPTPLLPVPFEPKDVTESLRLAKYIASASLVPNDLRNRPFNVLLVILKGRELGLTPLQAIGNIHIIEGKAEAGAHLIGAMILNSGKAEYFYCEDSGYDDNGEAYAVYVTRRKGWPEGKESRCRWDRQRAIKAKIYDKGSTEQKRENNNWHKFELNMCERRAQAGLGRSEYPDVVMGLYDFGEVGEQVDEIDMGPAVVVDTPEDAAEKASSLKDRMRAKAEAGRAHARGSQNDDEFRERIEADPQAEGPGTMPTPPRGEEIVDAELVEEDPAEQEPGGEFPEWMRTPEGAAPEASSEPEEEEVAEVVPLNGGDMTTEEKAEALADERTQAELDLDGEDDR
jgi:hypothetical protein